MPCPHFCRRDNDCMLAEELPKDDDEQSEVPLDEPVNRAWCTGEGELYRNCPVLRRYLADLVP